MILNQIKECKDSFEVLKKVKKIENGQANSLYHLVWYLHKNYWKQGFTNPAIVLRHIYKDYVICFYEYVDKMYDLYSDIGSNELLDMINGYIDYERVLQDDDDMVILQPFYDDIYSVDIFNEFLFDEDLNFGAISQEITDNIIGGYKNE